MAKWLKTERAALYLLCVLLLIFMFAGTIGHDPWWKRGEAYGFGIIYNFYITHTWLVPIDAGTPFLEKPPLYYWTAVFFCNLLGGVLALHDAARVASVFYTAITLVFTYKTAAQLFAKHEDRKALARINVAFLLGAHGIMQFSHSLLTDNALLTGTAIALYGMVLLATEPQQWKKAGFWLGIGMGVAFMAKGFIVPGIFAISGIILLLLLPALRTRAIGKAIAVAFIAAAPFLLIWPWLLYRESPDLFREWFWENNIGRFFGFSVAHLGAKNDRGHFFEILFTFAFPTLLFTMAEIWHSRKNWRDTQYCLPVVISVTGTLVFLVSASYRAPYLMPLMPSFSLLATQALPRQSVRFRRAVNPVLLGMFSIDIAIAWLTWWSVSHPPGARPLAWLPHLFRRWISVNYVSPETHIIAVSVAGLATLIWIGSLFFERKTAWDTARTWLTGVMALWAVTYLLMSPWINETKSFRTILTRFDTYISQSPYKNSCVGNYHMGENIPPMLQYFTGSSTPMPLMEINEQTCPVLLTFAELNSPTDIDPRWSLIWKDAGFSDVKGMELRLYARK